MGQREKRETDLSVKRIREAKRSRRKFLPRVMIKGFPTGAARPGPTNLLKKKKISYVNPIAKAYGQEYYNRKEVERHEQ